MTKSRGINAPKAVWTEEQIEMLRKFYPDYKSEDVACMVGHTLVQVYRKANRLSIEKSEAFLTSPVGNALMRPEDAGRFSRFQKGLTPWNKGKKIGTAGQSRETWFPPGQTPHNTRPIGSTKLDKSKVLLQKVSNDSGNNSKRWRGVHELVWVAANGPLPPKHIVVFKPGMKTNVIEEITIEKVECISLVENMKRNTRHRYPKEVANLIALKASLTRQINKRTKNESAENN